jgi:uncharacterized DUF497 family protein
VADYVDDDFEWDFAKSDETLARRGFDFFTASEVLKGLYLILPDERHSTDEIRHICIGSVGGAFLAVVVTDRATRIRIISARFATKDEIDAFAKEHGF